jgi:hypothetical protein
MPKTAADYIADMKHALGGDPDSRLNLYAVLNEAIEYLFNCHAWKWRKRPPVNLSFTATQEYITLPADFGEIVSIEVKSNFMRNVEQTSVSHIMFMRSAINQNNPSLAVYVALSWPTQTTTTAAPANPRLEIYPTPATTEANVLSIQYRAGAIRIATDASTTVPNIPPKLERALSLLCRAYVLHYEEETETISYDDFNREIGPHKEADGRTQGYMGQIMNGAARPRRCGIYRPFDSIPAHEP